MKLPPYYPRDPVILQDWADYLDCCRFTDKEVGDVIARLEKEKLLDDTVVFFMTDHGISHARGKQFLYDEGTHVPFVVRGPGIAKGVVRDDLIEHIDLAATSLALAGIEIPKWMQGRNVLAKDYAKRDAVFAARDRCDETMEHIRSVRTEQFKYIRNYLNERPHLQPYRYKDDKAIVQKLRELHAAKKLDELTEKLLFAETRPAEELYDLAADPHEVNNLAADPKHKATLDAMRKKLADWEERTGDKGRKPEPMAMYDSDMKVYLGGGKKDERRAEAEHRTQQEVGERGQVMRDDPFAVAVRLAASRPAADRRRQKPNVIFVLSDDLAQGDVGCYGQKLIKTPHLDAMAQEGTRFTQAYCGTSVCAPSRASLMTGLHTGHSPIRANREVQPEGQKPLPGRHVHRREAVQGQRLRHRVRRQVGHGHVRHPRQPAEGRVRPLLRLQLPAARPQLLPDVPLPRRQALRPARQRRQGRRQDVRPEPHRRRDARAG